MKKALSSLDIEQLKLAAEHVLGGTSVAFAYLYGSAVLGKMHAKSDIDIAVYMDNHDINNVDELVLAVRLERESGMSPIDIRVLNDRSTSYQGKVVQQGTLIYNRDEDTRINFERNALHRYLEYLPHALHLRSHYIGKVAREGIL